MVHLSSCLPTKDDTPVTPRRGPRSAIAHGKRRKRAQINTPTMEESEAPNSTSFFKKNQIPVVQPEDGLPRQPSWTVLSSRIVPRLRLPNQNAPRFTNSVPESYEDESSQESAPLGEIDTQPVGPAIFRAQRAYPWRMYVERQVQDTTEEEKEFLRFQEKQTHIQRLRALNLHLPFLVYTKVKC